MADIWGDIGSAAGKVWNGLAGGKPVSMADLKKKTALDDSMLSMAVGWLAREDKVMIDRKGVAVTVKLK
jgi:hypothetical protein